jgi:hypothetical protein
MEVFAMTRSKECPTLQSLARRTEIEALEKRFSKAPLAVGLALEATWDAENQIFLNTVPTSAKGAAALIRCVAEIAPDELYIYVCPDPSLLEEGDIGLEAAITARSEEIVTALHALAASLEKQARPAARRASSEVLRNVTAAMGFDCRTSRVLGQIIAGLGGGRGATPIGARL